MLRGQTPTHWPVLHPQIQKRIQKVIATGVFPLAEQLRTIIVCLRLV